MQAYGLYGPMTGLPDPQHDPQFYQGVPARRLFAWFVDVAIVLAIGVPLAVLFGLMTLGFGFVLFPLILMAVGFVYRTATIAQSSATWGMRFAGIEFRRGDGTRFDLLTALLHTVVFGIAFTVFLLQLVSCVTILGTRYGQSLPDLVVGATAINRPAD